MSDVKKPVILQAVPELAAGGAERTAIEIAAAVTRGGGRSFVISEGGRLEGELAAAGGELIRMRAASKNPAVILANAARMAAAAKACGASLIHARSRAPAWSAKMAARRLGLPFVTTYHGVYSQKGRLKSWYNGVMAAGDVVIANSEFTARVVAERHGTAPERLRVIHRGVDLARFSPDVVSRERVEALRRRWLIAPHERIVLHAARLTKWKGQTLFIDAVASAADAPEVQDAVFVIAGDAQGRVDYEHALRARIAASGLGARFRLTGHCDDMPAAFRAAHIAVVSPIEAEAFGRVSVEAQVMGCPVLATAVGALPETLQDGRTGWLTPPADAHALSRAIATALKADENQLRPMREAAAAFAHTHFSIDRMQAATLEVYDDLLHTGLAATFRATRLRES
jgi:glycosyltransferase involved in cell wall biosynthesis